MESVQSSEKEGSQRDMSENPVNERTPMRDKHMLNEYDESPNDVGKRSNSKQMDSQTLSRLSPIDQRSFQPDETMSMSTFNQLNINS